MAHPGILRAALEIAYDNGGINRQRSEAQHAVELEAFLAGYTCPERLPAIDAWLLDMDEDSLMDVCCGEDVDRALAMDGSPEGTDALLRSVFEEVC